MNESHTPTPRFRVEFNYGNVVQEFETQDAAHAAAKAFVENADPPAVASVEEMVWQPLKVYFNSSKDGVGSYDIYTYYEDSDPSDPSPEVD